MANLEAGKAHDPLEGIGGVHDIVGATVSLTIDELLKDFSTRMSLVGVADEDIARVIAKALRDLGDEDAERNMVTKLKRLR